ncbi:ferritin family protein [Desulfoprunum benzoelyticum]|uniref:Rubrerythrin n=1 Tax=Desulfoprunum benzoelyticum TaxID=1506996 RepID=A0A840UZA0_9BACT|nr:ferritin family protein [Desulfoprunum benzoelyticum]MBB5347978.1 rubrerythrin [Desulfoprunum benzoelyticum]MBM9530391.1 ferritin family protein [Desulfoprunum benzoelyticum]
MDFNDLTAIIDFAITQEQESADFYRRVGEKEARGGTKDLFFQFAAEEDKHRRLLEDLKGGGGGGALDDYRFTWIVDIKRSNYMTDLVYTPGMSYRDILMLAAQREEKALELYNLLLAKAEDEGARNVFKMLCQEEAKHKLALEGTLDVYMAEMGD